MPGRRHAVDIAPVDVPDVPVRAEDKVGGVRKAQGCKGWEVRDLTRSRRAAHGPRGGEPPVVTVRTDTVAGELRTIFTELSTAPAVVTRTTNALGVEPGTAQHALVVSESAIRLHKLPSRPT